MTRQRIGVRPDGDGVRIVVTTSGNRAVSHDALTIYRRRQVLTLYRRLGEFLDRTEGEP